MRPDDQEASWFALPKALGDAVDAMVAQLIGALSDRVNRLPWDEGEYTWFVDQWSPEDTMRSTRPARSIGHEQTHDYLDDLSGYWVWVADLDDFHR